MFAWVYELISSSRKWRVLCSIPAGRLAGSNSFLPLLLLRMLDCAVLLVACSASNGAGRKPQRTCGCAQSAIVALLSAAGACAA
jgi:hypothetical protein